MCLLCILVLYVILALWPPVLQYQLPALLFVCFIRFVFLVFLFVVVVSGEPRQKQGRGLVDHKLVQAPQYFLLLAVPRRLFCFGSLVILDVARWLFVVIHVIYKYKNR